MSSVDTVCHMQCACQIRKQRSTTLDGAMHAASEVSAVRILEAAAAIHSNNVVHE